MNTAELLDFQIQKPVASRLLEGDVLSIDRAVNNTPLFKASLMAVFGEKVKRERLYRPSLVTTLGGLREASPILLQKWAGRILGKRIALPIRLEGADKVYVANVIQRPHKVWDIDCIVDAQTGLQSLDAYPVIAIPAIIHCLEGVDWHRLM